MALSEASDGSNESTTSVAPRRDRGRESAVYSSAPSAVCQRKANDDKQQQEQRTPSKSKKAANRVRQNKPQAPPLFLRGLFGSVKRSGILTFEDGETERERERLGERCVKIDTQKVSYGEPRLHDEAVRRICLL